jgi:hypothetical protein
MIFLLLLLLGWAFAFTHFHADKEGVAGIFLVAAMLCFIVGLFIA